MTDPQPTAIVFVHGLWLTGIESGLLLQRLGSEMHCKAHYFHYPSVSAPMSQILSDLRSFVTSLAATTVHLVGHSLGGIVVLRLLETYDDLPPGRAVLLGAPVAVDSGKLKVARSVVAGRFVNCFCRTDWLLSLCCRYV